MSTKKSAKHSASGDRVAVKPKVKKAASRESSAKLPGRRATMPQSVELQLATLVKEAPSGDQWLHEIKFDGYRILCRLDGGKVRLLTRGDQDWTGRMPAIAAAAKKLPVERAILDGEVVALLPNGVSSFQRLQTAFRDKRAGELIYTDPEGSRHGLGALLVGYYDGENGGDKRLVYAGKVGTGFTQRLLADLRKRLDGLQQNESPFADFATQHRPRKAHWVKPKLVAQIEFSNWTDDGRLRHPSFQGLREDKLAGSVTREAQEANGKPTRANVLHAGSKRTKGVVADAENQTVAGVRLTNPDRLYYPEQGVTKLGLATQSDRRLDFAAPDRPAAQPAALPGRMAKDVLLSKASRREGVGFIAANRHPG